MKDILLDLRNVKSIGEETWADSSARAFLENSILDFAGHVVRVRITKWQPRRSIIGLGFNTGDDESP